MLALVVESWIWYGFATTVAACRFISRGLLFGSVLRLKVDDWLMAVAVCTYTTLVVCMNFVANKNSNLLPPGVSVSDMSPAERRDRILGSELVFVVELMQCCTIWLLKATLIIMYYRITLQLPQNLWVKVLAVYVAGSFVVMEVLYLGVWCRPITNYWALPTPNKQCDAATDHLITNAVFNISSDLMMLAIGFSLAIKSQLPWKRKIIVHAIFALGIFVIIASVLNKYYSFSNPFGALWTYWYIREASTAMIVANLPFCWTLIRKIFHVGAFSDEDCSDLGYPSSRSPPGCVEQRSSFASGALEAGEEGKPAENKDDGGSPVHSHRAHLNWIRGRAARPPYGRSDTDYTHAAVSPPMPAAKKWRERGVYGKDDVEAIGSDLDVSKDSNRERPAASTSARRLSNDGDALHFTDLVLNDVGNLGDAGPHSSGGLSLVTKLPS